MRILEFLGGDIPSHVQYFWPEINVQKILHMKNLKPKLI